MHEATFPTFLYVKIKNEDDEDQYLPLNFEASDDPNRHAEIGEVVRVARYRLDEVTDVTVEVKHKPRK